MKSSNTSVGFDLYRDFASTMLKSVLSRRDWRCLAVSRLSGEDEDDASDDDATAPEASARVEDISSRYQQRDSSGTAVSKGDKRRVRIEERMTGETNRYFAVTSIAIRDAFEHEIYIT